MRRFPIGLSFTVLLMAVISCNGDELAGPSDGRSPRSLETQATHQALTFIQVSAGTGQFGAHSCGITTANRIYCWGSNSSGELGNGTVGFEVRPVAVVGGIRFRSVSAGFSHTCAVALDHRAYCWGEGATGALGDGSTGGLHVGTVPRTRPALVAGGLRFRQVEAGHAHTCGLTMAHRVYCWGDNSEGQLGDGTTTRRLRPTLVSGGRRFRDITVSVGHSCALTTMYQAFCWGSNGEGRLGNGTTSSSLTPVAVASSITFRQISAGYFHTCAMSRDDRAYCWGYGDFGAIGDGAGVERLSPRAVAGGRTLERVDGGIYHTCGNGFDGPGFCWGYNGHGELGKGTSFEDHIGLTPSVVSGGLSFTQLSAGGVHSCGIATDGKAYCWGFNGSGQLGDGTLERSLTPIAVADPL